MDDIITTINEQIAAAISEVTKEQVMVEAIAEPVIIRDDTDEAFPAIIQQDGECKVSLFDDQYAIGAYHRMAQINYQEAAKGYGDGKNVQRIADMSLIVYGNRAAANQYDLAERIRTAIAKTKQNGREICNVTNINFNRTQVFAGEFGGIAFFLQPHVFLFRITYKISTALTKCTNNQRT